MELQERKETTEGRKYLKKLKDERPQVDRIYRVPSRIIKRHSHLEIF